MMTTEFRDLSSLEDLEVVFARSNERPQLIFKHSLTCPVSTAALQAANSYLGDAPSGAVDYWMIPIQKARPVSNAVAERVEIRHESPQAILVSEGRALWNASHWSITKTSLTEAIDARD